LRKSKNQDFIIKIDTMNYLRNEKAQS